MSTHFDEDKHRRASDGKFAPGDSNRDDAGQVAIDYSSSLAPRVVAGSALKPGMRVLHEGNVVKEIVSAKQLGTIPGISVATSDGWLQRYGDDDIVAIADDEENAVSKGTEDADDSLGREYVTSRTTQLPDGTFNTFEHTFSVVAQPSVTEEWEGESFRPEYNMDYQQHEGYRAALSALQSDMGIEDREARLAAAPEVNYYVQRQTTQLRHTHIDPYDEDAEEAEADYHYEIALAGENFSSLEDAERGARRAAKGHDWERDEDLGSFR